MASQLTETVGGRTIARHRYTGFYFAMSGAFLAIVLIGFAPTLYLRGMFFPVPPIPTVAYVHGFVMTVWFLLLFIQTGLIRTSNFQRHRQLGVVGAFVGLGVLIGGVTVTLGVVARLKGIPGVDFANDVSTILPVPSTGVTVGRFITEVVWGNLAGMFSFPVLFVAAILFRRQPALHKRLMLIASLSVLGQALQRVSRWPGLGGDTGHFTFIVMALLFAVIVVHDLVVTKRVQPATLFGGGVLVFFIVAANFVAATEFGQNFVVSL